MKKYYVERLLIASILSTSLVITACNSEGGACEYHTLNDQVSVVSVHDDNAVLVGAEEYEISLSDFPEYPKVGDQYLIEVDVISEGACNPSSVRSIERIPED